MLLIENKQSTISCSKLHITSNDAMYSVFFQKNLLSIMTGIPVICTDYFTKTYLPVAEIYISVKYIESRIYCKLEQSI